MIEKFIKIMQNIGTILIVAAFTIWSGDYWKISNYLWWAGIIAITPVIAWKAWPQSFLRQVIVALIFCVLLVIGKWWFGKKDIKVNIPYLTELTINRN